MTREWKPGDVALLPTGERAVADADGNLVYGKGPFEWAKPRSGNSQSARHLVVIDLPNGALAGWPVLIHALRLAEEKTGLHLVFGSLIDQIEAQTANPKPDEPQGLGAVVEDSRGELWIRDKTTTTQNHWKKAQGQDGGNRYSYSHVTAVKVLTEGVMTP